MANPVTWGELVQSRARSNRELGWAPEAQAPVSYVPRFDMSRKEREFDPVLQRFREDGAEQRACAAEGADAVARLNQSKVRQFQNVQTHDVINHEPVLRGAESLDRGGSPSAFSAASGTGPSGKSQRSRTGFNIISNLDKAHHHFVHPSLRPAAEVPVVAQSGFAQQTVKDFDIVSNRYKDLHEERSTVDAEQQKRLAAKKYWESHNFDPVSCRFYEPTKEAAFAEKRAALELEHGSDRQQRLPPKLREASGPGGPGDAEAFRLSQEERPPGIKAVVERGQQEAAVSLQRLKETRNVNRCTADGQRATYSYEHGYDIVNSRSFLGRSGIAKPALTAAGRQSLWQKIEAQATSSNQQ